MGKMQNFASSLSNWAIWVSLGPDPRSTMTGTTAQHALFMQHVTEPDLHTYRLDMMQNVQGTGSSPLARKQKREYLHWLLSHRPF